MTKKTGSVTWKIHHQSTRSNWLRYFMAAVAVSAAAEAQERVLLDYWWVHEEAAPEQLERVPRVIRVTGEKGESYEVVDQGNGRLDPALADELTLRQQRMRHEATERAKELIKEGKSTGDAYEQAWVEVYKREWLNANYRKPSSQLDELLNRIAHHDSTHPFTENEVRIAMEALMEDDDRLETEEGQQLLEKLANRLRAMGLGRGLDHTKQDELMELYVDAMQHGMNGMAAYRDALFKVSRSHIINHELRGYVAPMGGSNGIISYQQAPIKMGVTTQSASSASMLSSKSATSLTLNSTGMGSGAPAQNSFLASAPSTSGIGTGDDDEKQDEEKKKLAQEEESTQTTPLAMGQAGATSGSGLPVKMAKLAAPRALTLVTGAATVADVDVNVTEAAALYFLSGTQVTDRTQVKGSNSSSSTRRTYTVPAKGSYLGDLSWDSISGGNTVTFWTGNGSVSTPGRNRTTTDSSTNYVNYQGTLTIDLIDVHEGAALYIGGTAYTGDIRIQSDLTEGNKAVIGSYDTTEGTYNLGSLSGGGDVLFRGHNTSGDIIFDFSGDDSTGGEADWFRGVVYMASNSGNVQLNIANTHWAGTVFDFTNNADFSDSLIDSSGSLADSLTLNLEEDATILGLRNGDATGEVTGSGRLTLGSSGEDYTYGGTLSNVSLLKQGSNVQTVQGAASSLGSVTLSEGSLVFGSTLTAGDTSIASGTLLSTAGATSLGTTSVKGTLQSGGKVSVAGDAEVYNGTLSADGGLDVSGTYTQYNSTVTVGGFAADGGAHLLEGSLLVNGNASVGSAGVGLFGGQFTVDGTLDTTYIVQERGELSASRITADAAVQVRGGSLESKGTLDAGSLEIQNGTVTSDGAVTVSGNAEVYNGTLSAGGGLDVGGTYTQHSGTVTAGGFAAEGGAEFVGGILHVEGDATVDGGGVGMHGGQFTVNGTLTTDYVGLNRGIVGATSIVGASMVQVQGGTLWAQETLETGILELSAGTLTTLGSVSYDQLDLYGGTVWHMGSTVDSSGDTIYLHQMVNGPVTLGAANGYAGGVLMLDGATIDFSDAPLSRGGAPLFSLTGGTTIDTGSTLSMVGMNTSLAVGQEIAFATSTTGWTGDFSGTTVKLENATTRATGTLQQNGDDLVIIISSAENPQVVVEDGNYLWIHRFENESGHADGELEGINNATKGSSKYQWDGTKITDQMALSNLVLKGGSSLFIRDGYATNSGTINFNRADFRYDGNITIDGSAGGYAEIEAESTWARVNFGGHLGGSGKLRLVAEPNDDWSSVHLFSGSASDDAPWFSGEIAMRAPRGGVIQLNIGNVLSATGVDDRWQNTVFDLDNTQTSQSIYATDDGELARDIVLGLVGDARVAGIKGNINHGYIDGDGSDEGNAGITVADRDARYTLTLGEKSATEYVFQGRVGRGWSYWGGNVNSTAEGGQPHIDSPTGALSITKVGTNTQVFSTADYVDLDRVVVRDGGSLQFTETPALTASHLEVLKGHFSTSGNLAAGSLTLLSGNLEIGGNVVVGDTLNLDSGNFTHAGTMHYGSHVELDGGMVWNMGGNTEGDVITSFNLGNLNNHQVQLVAGTGVDWMMGGHLNVGESGWTDYNKAIFNVSGADVSLEYTLTLIGAEVTGAEGERFAIFELSDGATFDGSNFEHAYAVREDGTAYVGSLVQEGNTVYLTMLKQDDFGLDIDPLKGFIWSGENARYTHTGGTNTSAHHFLILGNVWRADGSAEESGWHEQTGGKGAGVFVNGMGATFADTDVHGEAETHRSVDIKGQVAPGTMWVTAEQNAWHDGEAYTEGQMKFGYAFDSVDGSGSIADVTDASGKVVTPTRIVKSGDALLVLNTVNSFTGGMEVQDGGVYVALEGALGTGTLTFHTDRDWSLPVVGNKDNDEWVVQSHHGGELMISYRHSNENLSSYRSGTVTNDIIMKSYDDSAADKFTISFGYAAYNQAGSTDDHANVPRHWRNLTLSGALVGTGSESDVLELRAYSSTWSNYRDQSYVTSFSFNENTQTLQYDEEHKRFCGTVVFKNNINTSPLNSNTLDNRTAGTGQLRLKGDKLKEALVDLSRETVHSFTVTDANGTTKTYTASTPRQTYANVLVLDGGTVTLRGLQAAFQGTGYYYSPTAEDSIEDRRSYVSDWAQNEEVWHVRTVSSSTTTLWLGENDEGTNDVDYVYSGAMGFAQSYTLLGQGHVPYGDGFDAEVPPNPHKTAEGEQFEAYGNGGQHTMALEALSLVKSSHANQFIHSATLDDLSVYQGMLGFNNLNLKGNLNLVGGSALALGVVKNGETSASENLYNTSKVDWDYIAENTQVTHQSIDTEAYELSPTSGEIRVASGKTLTVYTPNTGSSLPDSALVEGDVVLEHGAALTFVVNGMVPAANEDYEHTLLDINGAFNLENSTGITINFSGVDFSTQDFNNKTYFLASADSMYVDGADSSNFAQRLIPLGYGYFGILDTYDNYGSESRDYLVMTVSGDPRRTWSGMTGYVVDDEGAAATFAPHVWRNSTDVPASDYDYRWKENTAFENGQVVLFGNLYEPEEWTETSRLHSESTVKVESSATSPYAGTQVQAGDAATFNIDDLAGSALGYQKVKIAGEVAPVAIVINSDYTLDGSLTTDSTDYYFFGDGRIVDASEDELTDHGFDTNWLTNLRKMGTGTAVIATNNSYSGGTILEGGRLVMQHENALGTGKVTIQNESILQADFADHRGAADWPGYGGTYAGEGMLTSTIHNVVEVNVYVDPSRPDYSVSVDGRIANAHDKKLVLTELHGESDTVVMLQGSSVAGEGHENKYTYAVFKVLDPGHFSGTVQMDGNIWGGSKDLDGDGYADGGRVQLEVMTLSKSDTTTTEASKDWLNATIDLSLDYGTERTVLALDPMEGDYYDDSRPILQNQEVLINNLVGIRRQESAVNDKAGAMNSSVVNMSEEKMVTLVIRGLSSGDYDGVLGYGNFQRTLDYTPEQSSHPGEPEIGNTGHHYGAGGVGDLSVRKEGNATTQSVHSAWIDTLEVTGGVFAVDETLMLRNLVTGDGKRVFVGQVSDLDTVYALTVGAGGILAFDTQLFEKSAAGVNTSTKLDSLGNVLPGVMADNVAWVNLQNGSTLTGHSNWYTDTQMEISTGAQVTVNTHNYTPDPYITSNPEDNVNGVGNAHFEHFNTSHIIQLLGTMTGNNVDLQFTNKQMSPGATEEETGKADYMGYVAIHDHNSMTGKLQVEDKTVLQVFNTNDAATAGTASMNVTVTGSQAAMQLLDSATSQYISNLVMEQGGSVLVGGVEQTSLNDASTASGYVEQVNRDEVEVSLTNRAESSDRASVNNLHFDKYAKSVSLGGSPTTRADMEHVYMSSYDTPQDYDTVVVHDANLIDSVAELHHVCQLDLESAVLVDAASEIRGAEVVEDAAYVKPAMASGEPTRVSAGANVVTTSTETTVQLTFNKGEVQEVGNTSVYVAHQNQVYGVNVKGNGLTIQFMDDVLHQAHKAGAEYLAVQVNGGSGQFEYETIYTSSVMQQMIDDGKFVAKDKDGNELKGHWVTSETVAEDAGVPDSVTMNMLYFLVPEPGTATLSLLALTSLCARRRRKQ